MMPLPVVTAAAVLAAAGVLMLFEAALSGRNERALRAQGAVEPAGDVYDVMRLAYPLGFVLIAVEGALNDALPRQRVLAGLALFTLAKALKYWAIVTLGRRWSFRVLVLPGAPLISSGPYRYARHPNYVAVMGEFAGVALTLSALITGVLVTAGFAWLTWQRVRVEDRALGRRTA